MKKLFSAITVITYHNICCIWTRYEESSKIGKVEARDQLLLVLLILIDRFRTPKCVLVVLFKVRQVILSLRLMLRLGLKSRHRVGVLVFPLAESFDFNWASRTDNSSRYACSIQTFSCRLNMWVDVTCDIWQAREIIDLWRSLSALYSWALDELLNTVLIQDTNLI